MIRGSQPGVRFSKPTIVASSVATNTIQRALLGNAAQDEESHLNDHLSSTGHKKEPLQNMMFWVKYKLNYL